LVEGAPFDRLKGKADLGIIDLHTHTFLSDGVLLPSELVRRAMVAGYSVIGLTDHVGPENVESVTAKLVRAAEALVGIPIKIIPGVEVTHVPPMLIADVVRAARAAGARLIIVHGETPVEPVWEHTNQAAIAAKADILAHPGLITEAEAREAARMGVALELSARRGHCLTNGHVAAVARAVGARVILGSDAHEPGDLLTPGLVDSVLRGAGLGEAEAAGARRTAEELARKLLKG